MGPLPELSSRLREQASALSEIIAQRHLASFPDMAERFGPRAEIRCREDGVFHLENMAAAIAVGQDRLFEEYLTWTASVLAARGISLDDLSRHLQVTMEVVGEQFGREAGEHVGRLVESGFQRLDGIDYEPVPYLDESAPHGVLARAFLDALLAGERQLATSLITDAADSGVALESLYLDVFEPCLREIGHLWQLGQASVADEHFVTGAIQLTMAQLYPRIFRTERIGRTVVVACVGDELHAVGSRMVADFFELNGWDSYFLGADTPSEAAADKIAQVSADAVAISVTVATHLGEVQRLVELIRSQSAAQILVGGRAFMGAPDLWRVLGADGTAVNAREAVDVANGLLVAI